MKVTKDKIKSAIHNSMMGKQVSSLKRISCKYGIFFPSIIDWQDPKEIERERLLDLTRLNFDEIWQLNSLDEVQASEILRINDAYKDNYRKYFNIKIPKDEVIVHQEKKQKVKNRKLAEKVSKSVKDLDIEKL